MTIRKRKTPTPHFKLPHPFNPVTGERADLAAQGKLPYCAMMQVAEEDTHDNYVVCRGYDPRIRKFIDYDAEDLDNKPGVPVGKPYGKRTAGQYTVGQVFAAAIPVTRIGETPGVAATTQGHPADLDEAIEILYDDDGVVITWLLLDAGGSGNPIVAFCTGTFSLGTTSITGTIYASDTDSATVGGTITISIPPGDKYNTSGSAFGYAARIGSTWYLIDISCPDFDAGALCVAGTPSASSTATSSATGTSTATGSSSATWSISGSDTASPTQSASSSASATSTATGTSTASGTPSSSETGTPSATSTPSASSTGSATKSATATASATSTSTA